MTESIGARPILEEPPAGEIMNLRKQGLVWQVDSRYASQLQSCGVDWLQLKEGPNATLVKRNSQRDVWCVTCSGKEFFAKFYHPHGFAARFKRFLRGPVAMREWSVGRYAMDCGIGTVVPVATAWSGSRTDTGPSLLITEAVPGVAPLNEYWLDIRSNRDGANQVTDSLAQLIAKAHQCGYRHCDMHPGNILVRKPNGEVETRFVDLHDVEVGSPISERQVVTNIALLNQWFRRNATLAQRLRFLKAYLRYREAFTDASPFARDWQFDLDSLAGQLRQEAERHARKLWAKRDRRTLRTGRYFAKIKLPGGWAGHVLLRAKHIGPTATASKLTYTKDQWKTWLRSPLDWIDPAKQTSLKDSHTATVCKAVLTNEPEPAVAIVKRPLPRTLWKRIDQMFGRSRNMRSWRIAHMLHNRDLPVAQPLAVVEKHVLGFIRLDSIGFTEFIDDTVDLEGFLTRDVAALDVFGQYRVKPRLTETLVHLLKTFGNRGFVHRDMKAPNLLVRWDAPFEDEPLLTFIDMDGISHVRSPSDKQRTRAIVRLCASLLACPVCTRADRLRFLKAYLTGPGRSPAKWKDHWRRLDVLVRSKQKTKEARRKWKLEHYGRE